MKKIICSFILIVILSIPDIFAQDDSYLMLRADHFCYKKELSIDKWSKYSEWESCNILVNLDINKNKLTIYSKDQQVYYFSSGSTEYYDRESHANVTEFIAITKNNSKCMVRFVMFDDNNNHLYILYSDVIFVYNVNVVE